MDENVNALADELGQNLNMIIQGPDTRIPELDPFRLYVDGEDKSKYTAFTEQHYYANHIGFHEDTDANLVQRAVISGNLDRLNLALMVLRTKVTFDHAGYTAMHYAVMLDRTEMVKRLIEMNYGLNMGCGTSLEITPLHLACYHNHTDVLNLLVAIQRVELNAQMSTGFTALHLATYRNHIAAANTLIEIRRVDREIPSLDDGFTPLHRAIQFGHLEVAESLLRNNAKVTALTNDSSTPLILALQTQRWELATAMLELSEEANAGMEDRRQPLAADEGLDIATIPLVISKLKDVNAQDEEGFSALHLAAGHGRVEIVRLLLERGADSKLTDRLDMSPLHLAAFALHDDIEEEYCEVIDLLYLYGASFRDASCGYTALHYAARYGTPSMVNSLLNRMTFIDDVCEPWHMTSLHYAVDRMVIQQITISDAVCRDPSAEMVELMIAKGADVNAVDKGGCSPLHYAAEQNDQVLVRLLLQAGSMYNLPNMHWQTPRLLAERNVNYREENIDILERVARFYDMLTDSHQLKFITSFLCDNPWMVGCRNADNMPPLTMVVQWGFTNLVEQMLMFGADPDGTDGILPTPLNIAVEKSLDVMSTLLLRHGATFDIVHPNGLRTPLAIAEENGHAPTIYAMKSVSELFVRVGEYHGAGVVTRLKELKKFNPFLFHAVTNARAIGCSGLKEFAQRNNCEDVVTFLSIPLSFREMRGGALCGNQRK